MPLAPISCSRTAHAYKGSRVVHDTWALACLCFAFSHLHSLPTQQGALQNIQNGFTPCTRWTSWCMSGFLAIAFRKFGNLHYYDPRCLLYFILRATPSLAGSNRRGYRECNQCTMQSEFAPLPPFCFTLKPDVIFLQATFKALYCH